MTYRQLPSPSDRRTSIAPAGIEMERLRGRPQPTGGTSIAPAGIEIGLAQHPERGCGEHFNRTCGYRNVSPQFYLTWVLEHFNRTCGYRNMQYVPSMGPFSKHFNRTCGYRNISRRVSFPVNLSLTSIAPAGIEIQPNRHHANPRS